MVNQWMQTVRQVRDQMPKGTPLKEILIAAKKVYKKPVGLVKKVAKRLKKAVTGKSKKGTRKKAAKKGTRKKATKKAAKKRKKRRKSGKRT
jgi:hypothetical protein